MSAEQQSAPPSGRYRHFKGNEYEVLGVARHSESGEPLVVYRALYGGYGLFVRPQSMFIEMVTRDGVTQPRFSRVGPSDLRKLSHEAQADARAFLLNRARPLEAALYAREFEEGPLEAVYAALAQFRNDDGGFGHGLEPDFTTANSSVLATTTALQTLRHLGAPPDNALVRGALAYLGATFDADLTRWPLIPAAPTIANDAPHAPWWSAGPEHATLFREYAVNPRAEVLGYLYTWPTLAEPTVVAQVESALASHFAQLDKPLDMNEMLCTLRLLDAPGLPASLRSVAQDAFERSIESVVAQDAEAWESYTLQPLQVAPAPLSPFAAALAPLLAANLDFRILAQEDDGSWAPQWNWGPLFPAAWPAAQCAWQGVLTLEALRSLRAYGRFAL